MQPRTGLRFGELERGRIALRMRRGRKLLGNQDDCPELGWLREYRSTGSRLRQHRLTSPAAVQRGDQSSPGGGADQRRPGRPRGWLRATSWRPAWRPSGQEPRPSSPRSPARSPWLSWSATRLQGPVGTGTSIELIARTRGRRESPKLAKGCVGLLAVPGSLSPSLTVDEVPGGGFVPRRRAL
jgi:hypothetical protein